MRGLILLIMLSAFPFVLAAQDADPAMIVQQVETLAASTEKDPGKEDLLKNLDLYLRHPLNINTADQEDLKGLVFLNDEQIRNFILYRKLFGAFISKYEMQAIPGWDLATIEKIFPFVIAGSAIRNKLKLADLLTKGDQSILFRMGRSLSSLPDFDPDSSGRTKFPGSRDHVFLKYKYNYRNSFEWQLLGDKDAGEQFLRGSNRYGFDFNSFHVTLKNVGIIKMLVIGDFTVTMGQGLIQWQGIALTKSADITSVKRSSPVIRPYTSSGEADFFRGVGSTIKLKNWEASLFLSRRSISATIDIDSINDPGHISSIQSSGYHRTETEQSRKNNVEQLSSGASLVYSEKDLNLSVNAVFHHLSKPIKKESLPYNLYALSGNNFLNGSIEMSKTIRNIHLFGEAALDKRLHSSFVCGAMISLSTNFDLSFVNRILGKSYQSLYASAFSENEMPANENGFYAGMAFRPASGLTVGAYVDFFHFPWLKYRVNAPSYGREFSFSIQYVPDKKTELALRVKSQYKPVNSDETVPLAPVITRTRSGLQLQGSFTLSKAVVLKNRIETSRYEEPETAPSRGFLFFTDLGLKPSFSKWSLNMRLQYFEADNYDARIYAYENVMSYSFGFPAYYQKGYRGYLNYHRDLTGLIIAQRVKSERIGAWLRLASTYFPSSSLNNSHNRIAADAQIQVLLSF